MSQKRDMRHLCLFASAVGHPYGIGKEVFFSRTKWDTCDKFYQFSQGAGEPNWYRFCRLTTSRYMCVLRVGSGLEVPTKSLL